MSTPINIPVHSNANIINFVNANKNALALTIKINPALGSTVSVSVQDLVNLIKLVQNGSIS